MKDLLILLPLLFLACAPEMEERVAALPPETTDSLYTGYTYKLVIDRISTSRVLQKYDTNYRIDASFVWGTRINSLDTTIYYPAFQGSASFQPRIGRPSPDVFTLTWKMDSIGNSLPFVEHQFVPLLDTTTRYYITTYFVCKPCAETNHKYESKNVAYVTLYQNDVIIERDTIGTYGGHTWSTVSVMDRLWKSHPWQAPDTTDIGGRIQTLRRYKM